MNRSAFVLASAVVAIPALVMAAGPQSSNQPPTPAPSSGPGAPAAQGQPKSPETLPNNTNSDGTLKVVVHKDQTTEAATDGRTEVGGVRISMPSSIPGVPAVPPASPGTIAVPLNTIGPGEPMWLVRERADADRKIAEAHAEVARSVAEHTDAARAYYESYSTYGSGYFWQPGFASHGLWNGGLYGPVTTTTTYSDHLGSTAQRAYSDAAYPRLNGSQDAHDRAVQQFGRDATPPINRIQNDVDKAHQNANQEHPQK